jgi:hypothetical protein
MKQKLSQIQMRPLQLRVNHLVGMKARHLFWIGLQSLRQIGRIKAQGQGFFLDFLFGRP